MKPEAKKCGNCGHFTPDSKLIEKLKKQGIKDAYAYKGKCEINGKSMNPELLAGCFFWTE